MAEVMSIEHVSPLEPAVTPETTRAERSVEQILLWEGKEGSADYVGPVQPIKYVHGADEPCLVDKPDL